MNCYFLYFFFSITSRSKHANDTATWWVEIKFCRRRYYKFFIFIFIIFYLKEINKIRFLTDCVENSIHNKRKIGNLITHDINLSTLDFGSGSENPQKLKCSYTKSFSTKNEKQNSQIISIKDCTVHIHYDK